jgi:FkbM family methyltransferase
MELNDPCG